MIWGRGKPPNAKQNRRSRCWSIAIVRFRHPARTTAVALATVVLLFCNESYAAKRVLEWVDDLSCTLTIRFDPKKHDEARVQNTADFVFSLRGFSFPIPQGYLRETSSDPDVNANVDAYKRACAGLGDRLATIPLIHLLGIEAYRNLKLEQLKDWCDFGVARIRGSFGDIAALRGFTPSAVHCSRYLDGLEGKTDIKHVWREVIASTCKQNSSPQTCMAGFLAAENQPGEVERIKRDVLSLGWQNCSTRYLKTGNSVDRTAASMRAKLDAMFRKRFKVTRPASCAD